MGLGCIGQMAMLYVNRQLRPVLIYGQLYTVPRVALLQALYCTSREGPSNPIRWARPKEGDEADQPGWVKHPRRVQAIAFVRNELYPP